MTRAVRLLACVIGAALVSTARPARADDLTMDRAVGIALQRNRDVIAARLDIEASQVDRIAAGLYWNPIFTYQVGNVVLGAGNPQGVGLNPGPLSELVQTVGISEVIDVWAKRSARIRAANIGIEQRTLLVEDALREIVFNVRGAYSDLAREQAEIDLSRTMKARYDETIRLSRARANAGEISPSELRKIELEGLKYQNALIDAQLELDLAQQHLAALLGFRSAAELPGAALPDVQPRTSPAVAPLVARAMEQRPDMRAARKGMALADAQLSAAEREGYPDISVGAAYTHSEFTISGDNANALGLSVSLPLPIFDHNQAGIARARVDRKRSDNEIRRLTLIVEHEVAETVRRVERSATLLDVYEGGMLTRADDALRVAESSYKAGAISLLELLEAQRTYIETRADYLKVQDDYRKAKIDVARAVGEGTP